MRFGGLYETIIQKNIPFFGVLEITTRCNNSCVHCYNAGEDTLEVETIKKFMDQSSRMGTLFLSITGGEPLLHENIWEILEYARDLNFATLLYSNATLIGKDEAKRIKDAGVYHVDTTLLGATPELHDRLAGKSGAFDRTMEALTYLTGLGVNTAVKTPVMNMNAQEVDKIKTLVEKLKIDHIASPLIFAKDDGDTSPLALRPEEEQLKQFFSKHEIECIFEREGIYPCHFGVCTFAVKANGDITPCISVPLPFGNIKHDSFKDVWEDSEGFKNIRDKSRRPVGDCAGCENSRWCFRCEGISYIEEGKLYSRAEELCRMARVRKEVASVKS